MAAILVVEDNAVTRKLVRFALETKGYDVIEAAAAKAALEAVEKHGLDLVLQDLILPDMDGFELALQLRARLSRPRVPILAFAGFVSKAEEARIAAAGFDDVIVKPVVTSRLLQVVEARLCETARVAGGRFGEGRVLVVADDDRVQAKFVAFKLEQLGFRVVTASDGAEALELARTQRADGIVSDVMMPDVDGFRLCIEARRDLALNFLPVILITSSDIEEADCRLAREAGANACVLRTPDLKQLIAALRTAFEPAISPSTPPPVDFAEVDRSHARRVVRQLERQVQMNAGVSQRCAVLSAELSILGGISSALSQSRDLDASLDEVLSTLFDAGGISTGALFLFEQQSVRVRSVGTQEFWSDEVLATFFGDLDELQNRCAIGAAVTLPEESGFCGTKRALESASLRSALLAPLVCYGELVGALFLTSREERIGEQDRITFAVSASAQIAQGIGLARAFAAQASAMRDAQESEARLRSMMESSADGIVVADERGRFLYWNPAAEPFLETSLAEPSPAPSTERHGLFLPDRATPFPPADLPLTRAVRGEHVRQAEVFVRNAEAPNGAWLSINAQPLIAADGRHCGGVAVLRDVTTERAMHEQLMLSDRMASVGMLAAGVAHEINNPLASVVGNIQLASDGIAALTKTLGSSRQLDDLREELKDASEGADRIRNIVRDLKLFSCSEEDKTGPVNIFDVMESTLRMAWNEIRHRAQLVRNYENTGPVEASESRLGQVFLNLIVNAAQAIGEGGAEHNEIRVSTRTQRDGQIAIEISDTGAGIPPEVLRRLFTPFFTTKPVGVGTGLGLSICRRIITGFGGSIDVKSELGKGTTVLLTLLPAHPPEVQAAAVVGLDVAGGCQRRGRILVVDDEPMIGEMIHRTLSGAHEVIAISSAESALARVASGEHFDAIICDLMMPQMTGMDLHAGLLRFDPEQAAMMIFMTGGAFTPKARAFLDKTPNHCIEKPFDCLALRAFINERVRAADARALLAKSASLGTGARPGKRQSERLALTRLSGSAEWGLAGRLHPTT